MLFYLFFKPHISKRKKKSLLSQYAVSQHDVGHGIYNWARGGRGVAAAIIKTPVNSSTQKMST